jgi:hypothetical protein
MWTLSLENGDFITGKCGFYHWKMWILYHWKMVILSLEHVDFITGKW